MFQTDKTIERSKKYDTSSEQSGWNCRGLGLTPKEIGLRTRLHNLKNLYEYESAYWSDKSIAACWSNELTEKFLSLQPTTSEVKHVLIGSELILKLNCQNHRTGRGWVDNPDKPGWMKRDMEEYIKLVKIEAQKRQEIMQQAINIRKKYGEDNPMFQPMSELVHCGICDEYKYRQKNEHEAGHIFTAKKNIDCDYDKKEDLK
jgi:hypothetical protein